ncbi:carbon-monoxide dehydrogenase [Knoellia sinensis KCTC 19936]|uniref:Carbon-monoxide dehydrogenase n=1 Tax=Knoellia sinensis KCTC 19936 TaxID=1385520 RepID=A0A0A0J5E5_9MICO|nr:molybdopterin cofactor-binding domain-containing protein [Knoellia sinensis]KGN31322.1 carbon-monoxide dehydrogenase [Knoellia sinensis KCTC 19936]
MSTTETERDTRRPEAPSDAGGVGDSAPRPDGILKVSGEFAYGSDLWMADMLWGTTLRSPHPHARIARIDLSEALAVPGVYAVLTSSDVPGTNLYGLEHADQPVLASDVVRYEGEPVAVVAADHPETARRAAGRIRVDYEVLDPVTDARTALQDNAPRLHPDGNLVRHLKIRTGDPEPTAEVVVTGEFEVGMQDQAFLGPESGMAIPDGEGGVDLHVATQWLHADQAQVCTALGLRPDQVRLSLAGVGGAFGGREDLSMHIHACLLALHTGRPVKMVYSREESFFGHVHRHPALLHYEFGADRTGQLVYARAETWLDGGAYASSTGAVVGNAATLGLGPYVIPSIRMDCWGAYTNNPPCGAMRGFGATQAAFAYEAMMDRMAAALEMDPVEFRVRNAMAEGSHAATGQLIDSAAPVAELLERVRDLPMPGPLSTSGDGVTDLRELPGGVSNTTHGEAVRRGVGYGVGIKNVGFSMGFDDFSTVAVRLELVGGEPTATVHTAAAEVGQGLVTVMQQICRTELGVERVVIAPIDTAIGGAGSTSASRQTYVTGGATQEACRRVRARLPEGGPGALGDTVIEETVEWRHRPTHPVDPETGQGDAHVQFAFAAHRAVVDVDVELGLVKVVELACAQDVGRAMNPDAVIGQIHGGAVQGLGLAVMEEIQIEDGHIRNPSFTDYLIPTILDTPSMPVDVLEYPDPHAPYGLRGVGEPPNISSGPAIVAAIRAATGLDLSRVPVRPEHLTRQLWGGSP